MKELFPLNVKNTELKIRFKETYKVNRANTERYKQSAIPYLQNLLNEDEQNRNKEKKRYIWYIQLKIISLKVKWKCA